MTLPAQRRLSSRKVVLTAAFLALAAGGTAACDSSPDEPAVSYDFEPPAETGSAAGSQPIVEKE